MITILIKIIGLISQLLILLVVLDTILFFFLPPYNNFRKSIDQLVNPMLKPIRKFVPLVGNIDFSPLILVIMIQIVSFILIRILEIMF